jgi:hypothetical protein
MKLEFSGHILEKKNLKYKIFIIILPVAAELFHDDGRTVGRMDGRTEGYDGTNHRFSQYCDRA